MQFLKNKKPLTNGRILFQQIIGDCVSVLVNIGLLLFVLPFLLIGIVGAVEFLSTNIMASVMCIALTLGALGIDLLILKAIKKNMKNSYVKPIFQGNYYICINKVSGRDKREYWTEPFTNPTQNIEYFLFFENRPYIQYVSEREFNSTPDGAFYYSIHVYGLDNPISYFAESDYYLHKSIQNKFKTF